MNRRNYWSKGLIGIGVASLVQLIFGFSAIADVGQSTSQMSSADILRRRCTLDSSDTTFEENGRPFDRHFLLSGRGQVVTVILESDDFDADFSIFNPDGDLIAYNDDMSTYVGNSTLNAGTALQMWDDGVYTIFASTTGSTGVNTGEYSLLVVTPYIGSFTTQPQITAGCTGT